MHSYSTAVHEAGHVVAALACGLEPRRATVVPDAGRAGHVHFGRNADRAAPDDFGVVLLAGPLAAATYCQTAPTTDAERDDLALLARLVGTRSRREERHERILQRTRRLLATHRGLILGVADQLAARGTLDDPAELAALGVLVRTWERTAQGIRDAERERLEWSLTATLVVPNILEQHRALARRDLKRLAA